MMCISYISHYIYCVPYIVYISYISLYVLRCVYCVYHVYHIIYIALAHSRPPAFTLSHSVAHFLVKYSSSSSAYGVATISRLLKITGLFCKRAL